MTGLLLVPGVVKRYLQRERDRLLASFLVVQWYIHVYSDAHDINGKITVKGVETHVKLVRTQ